jgi:SAM-dependent methyltransferase
MAEADVDFGQSGPPSWPDGRFNASSFHRNREPLKAVLHRYLGARSGDVLEVGSGTGQHVAAYALAFPKLTWWPSDVAPDHRASVVAWCAHAGVENARPPLVLDAASDDWPLGVPGAPPAGGLVAMLNLNVVHISPWAVAEGLMAGAGRHLKSGGLLFMYGPFKIDGRHTAPSNAQFDQSLRGRNAQWGIRDMGDLEALAVAAGLSRAGVVDMPSNNFTLVFEKP